VWEHLPAVEGREASVHLAQFPKPEEVFSEDPESILSEWKRILAVRDQALVMLEESRQAKTIGKALEADITIIASGPQYSLMQRHLTGLKEVFNVSTVTVIEAEEPTDGISTSYGRKMSLKRFSEYEIGVSPATGHKCARCWNFMPEVSDYGIWQNVCTRCQGALTEMGIPPPQPEAAQ